MNPSIPDINSYKVTVQLTPMELSSIRQALVVRADFYDKCLFEAAGSEKEFWRKKTWECAEALAAVTA